MSADKASTEWTGERLTGNTEHRHFKHFIKYLRVNEHLVIQLIIYTYDAQLKDDETTKEQNYNWTMTDTVWQQVLAVLQQHLVAKLHRETDMSKKAFSSVADIYRGSDFHMIYQFKPLEDRPTILIPVSFSLPIHRKFPEWISSNNRQVFFDFLMIIYYLFIYGCLLSHSLFSSYPTMSKSNRNSDLISIRAENIVSSPFSNSL
jgi:hypothetical protein